MNGLNTMDLLLFDLGRVMPVRRQFKKKGRNQFFLLESGKFFCNKVAPRRQRAMSDGRLFMPVQLVDQPQI